MKRLARSVVVLALCTVMVLSLCGTACAAGLPTGYSLTEVAKVGGSDINYEINSSRAIVSRRADEENQIYLYRIYDYQGNQILDEELFNTTEIVEGVYCVAEAVEDVNTRGAVTMEGEVLIPTEAAIIKKISNSTGAPDRFLEVIYATERVENESDAFFYVTDSYFSLHPSDEDVLYAGYARVYDLVNKQFVGDLEVHNPSVSALEAAGDYFVYNDGKSVNVYDANGNVTLAVSGYVSETGENMVVVSDRGYFLYDAGTGEKLLFSEDMLQLKGGYMNRHTDGKYSVLDLAGNPVTSQQFEIIYGIQNGIARGEIDEDVSALYDLNNDRLLCDMSGMEDTDAGYSTLNYGYFSYDNAEGAKTVVTPRGDQFTVDNCYSMVFYRKDGDATEYYVFRDGDFTLKLDGNGGMLTEGMIGYRSEGEYGVYDLFSGEVLVPFQYKSVSYGGGYLFCYDGSTYTVYKPELNY